MATFFNILELFFAYTCSTIAIKASPPRHFNIFFVNIFDGQMEQLHKMLSIE
jgi:hypothetical protein